MKNLKILQIAYHFPPTKSGGVLRNFYRAKDFKKAFKKSIVITSEKKTEYDNPENLDIRTTKAWDYRSFFNSKKKNFHFDETKKERGLIRFFIRLIDSFPINILIGEGGFFYILNAYGLALKLIREHNIQVIYSSFRPYSDHVVAYLVKRKIPNLKWIADFRDPHIDPKRKNVLFPKLQHKFNKIIFRKADLVTTVSEGLANYFQQYRPDVKVIYNGPPEAIFEQKVEVSPSPFFKITYTGSLYKDFQFADVFWITIQKLLSENKINHQKLQIIYAGKDSTLFKERLKKYGLENYLKDYGIVPHKTAMCLQKESDLNLLLTWSSENLKGILTGKLYEYLAARKPILTIISGVKDLEFDRILNQTNSGIAVLNRQEDIEAIEIFLMGLYIKNDKSSLLSDKNEILKFSAENQFKTLYSEINSLFK